MNIRPSHLSIPMLVASALIAIALKRESLRNFAARKSPWLRTLAAMAGTSSARSRRCAWQWLIPLQVLTIAITGLPCMSACVRPSCNPLERWPKPRKSHSIDENHDNRRKKSMSKNWYSDLPQYYQRQIKAMGLTPSELQASISNALSRLTAWS